MDNYNYDWGCLVNQNNPDKLAIKWELDNKRDSSTDCRINQEEGDAE